jgi:peptidyl-prolyl cis-trans isomerase SurA
LTGFDLTHQVIRMSQADLLNSPKGRVRSWQAPEKSTPMTSSRYFYIPAILLLSAGLAAAPALAQTAGETSATAAAGPANGKVVEDIVARVNDQIVTQSDYDRALGQMRTEAQQQDESQQAIDFREKNLLRDLIDQQLLLSRGKELDITGEAELVQALDKIRQENHLDSMEALEKAAQDQGVSYEDFTATIRNRIISQQVIRDEVSRHVQITQQDMEAYFKAHQSDFAQPESVHLREILVATPADSTADSPEVTAAQQQADAIETKLKGGASFEDLAKTSSSGPAADRGGDLGDFRRGTLAKQLEDATFSLQAGQFTGPIRTKQGYVILEVDKHTPGGEANFKDVQPQVEDAVFTQRLEPALRAYLTKLREAAYIDIKPGFTDSGASADEMHPSYSAYTPPGPKKKKKYVSERLPGKAPADSSNPQAAGETPSTTSTPTAAAASNPAPQTAAASNPAPQTAAAKTNPADSSGKKVKVRYGQAPQTNLAAGQSTAVSSSTETGTQTASAANPNVGNVIGGETPDSNKQEKTRFSQRPTVPKVKKPNGSGDDQNTPNQDEVAAQKVQDTPLGLAPPPVKAKKKKEKGEKTRYAAAKPKQPETQQQPYMGGQRPVNGNAPAAAPPAAGSEQPRPTAPDGGTQP